LLDIDSVARSLVGSSRYVQRLVAERRNAYVKVGHLVRLKSVDVSRWIDESRVDAMRPAPGERGPGNGTGRSRPSPPAELANALSWCLSV
jgi:excisionase family DNA binding protein